MEEPIRKMTVKDAERIGINTSTIWKAKKKIKEGKTVHLSNKIIKKLENITKNLVN